jgi:hypothetical protein
MPYRGKSTSWYLMRLLLEIALGFFGFKALALSENLDIPVRASV